MYAFIKISFQILPSGEDEKKIIAIQKLFTNDKKL